MRRLDDQYHAVLHTRQNLSVEGTTRVSGFDATVDGHGARFEQRIPESVTVRRGGNVQVLSLRQYEPRGHLLAMMAMPLAAFAIARFTRAPKSKRKGR